jgi:hypothetical protein
MIMIFLYPQSGSKLHGLFFRFSYSRNKLLTLTHKSATCSFAIPRGLKLSNSRSKK